jgi:hypothetical protein
MLSTFNSIVYLLKTKKEHLFFFGLEYSSLFGAFKKWNIFFKQKREVAVIKMSKCLISFFCTLVLAIHFERFVVFFFECVCLVGTK